MNILELIENIAPYEIAEAKWHNITWYVISTNVGIEYYRGEYDDEHIHPVELINPDLEATYKIVDKVKSQQSLPIEQQEGKIR